jgi:hypothetical protein
MKRTLATASVVALAASAPAFGKDMAPVTTYVTARATSDNEMNRQVVAKAAQSSELDNWDTTAPVWTPFRH